MRNNLFKQVNSLIDKKTNTASSPVLPRLGNNQNVLGAPIIIDSGSNTRLEQLNTDINLIKTNMVGIPERILSGMEVKAVSGGVVSVNSGSVYTKKGVFELQEQSSYRIDVSTTGTQYIVVDNGILKTSNEINDNVLLIAKIVINVADNEIDDNANADYSNNYIVSGRDLAINPQFEIDDDTRLMMSNILQEILASNLVGTIRLNEGLDITNQQDSVRLNSTGMGIYNDGTKFAEFIRDGIYFYNESGLMLSQYTKDGATIGNINILPDSIESTNFKSGNRGFKINSNGNVEFNNITARGTIIGRDGLIAGWHIRPTLLASALSGKRVELDKGNNRVSIFDATNEKVVMGYLNGLPKNDGTGNWGAGDYGFWARSGDKLAIDGDVDYIDGDWLVQDDANVKILNSSDNEIIRLGTDGTDKGLFIYNTSGTQLAKYVSDEIFVGGVDDYLKYTTADGLEIKGDITADSGTIGGLTVESDKMYLGDGEYADIDTPFYVDNTGQFSLNDRFQWDGESLSIHIESLNDWIPYSVENEGWTAIIYGDGKFISVAGTATGEGDGFHRAMISKNDGITWEQVHTPSAGPWVDVEYGNGIFVACAYTTGGNSIMTSPDGITWTLRAVTGYNWLSVTYGNGTFVVVGNSDKVITSSDGITWSTNTVTSRYWTSITYGNEKFVAIEGVLLGSGVNNIMYSADGTSWTEITGQTGRWQDITYGLELFVAVSRGGDNYIQTSTDGITWTSRTQSEDNSWNSVTYGSGYYVAVSFGGTNRIMTSPDGITWTSRTQSEDNSWTDITYGNGKFIAVSYNGTNRIMKSGVDILETNEGFKIGSMKSHTLQPTKFFNSDNIEIGTLCRAWVNFDGTDNTNLTGTYERSGTTVTVTANDHQLLSGSSVYLDFTSGSATDGIFEVTEIIDEDTFTVTHGTSGTTSGNVTLIRNTIRASFNVSSITDNGTGDYTINFENPMPDDNYCIQGTGEATTGGYSSISKHTSYTPSTSAVRIVSTTQSSGLPIGTDITFIGVAVFR